MKRLLVRMAIFIVTINLVLAGVFLSAGGMQMLSRPTLPKAGQPPSLSADVAFLREVVLANEAGVSTAQQAQFTKIIADAPVPTTADELTLLASRSLAAFDNAHTTVLKSSMYRLPVRVHWTADALIIVKARPEYAGLLGRRILSLGERTPEALLERMPQLVGGGTKNWARYRSAYFFSAPSALSFLGADVERGAVEVRTASPDGSEETRILRADSALMPGDPFWDFLDAFPGDEHFETEGWVTLLRKNQDLPLYLQVTDKFFLLRDLPEHDAIYVRMNASFDDKAETVGQFKRRILAQIKVSTPRSIIVDFRHNRGGDYTKVLPLVRALSKAVPVDGQLYLITGPNTFSAGLVAGSQFKRFLPDRLTIVGSEVGDKLRFRAEGFYPTLPKSQIRLYLTKGWSDLADGCGWFDDCWPPNKVLLRPIGSLDIDIDVENTWAAFRDGQDLVVNAVLDDIAQRSRK